MSKAIQKYKSYGNLTPSFDVVKRDITDYQKINWKEMYESSNEKHCRFEYGKQAFLIAAILFSHPDKYSFASLNPNGYVRVDFKQSQIPSSSVIPRIDSRLFYVPNKLDIESAGNAKLKAEFNKLIAQWREETFSISSLTKIYAHPAYQRIMAMGTAGLPFVLRELQNNQGHWFYALKFMAGEDGKDIAAGLNNYEDARAAWLEWGYNNNYI